ncbi:hypothetical protein AAFF39_03715 [Lactococcus garvieae]
MSVVEEWAEANLDSFKHRMRISSDDPAEMESLEMMLGASYTAILRLVGVQDAQDLEVKELIFERARYAYNDALDEFEVNYRRNINLLFLAHKPKESEEAND